MVWSPWQHTDMVDGRAKAPDEEPGEQHEEKGAANEERHAPERQWEAQEYPSCV
jgi:hypothetical protein